MFSISDTHTEYWKLHEKENDWDNSALVIRMSRGILRFYVYAFILTKATGTFREHVLSFSLDSNERFLLIYFDSLFSFRILLKSILNLWQKLC